MKRDELVYLRHIMDAIAHIERYAGGINEDTFRNESIFQDAIIRQLEIVGEAIKHLPDSFREKYPNIPWQDIAGTRDILIHHYFGVNLDEVWCMVQKDLPVLKVDICAILGEDLKKWEPKRTVPHGLWDRITLVGCGVVAFIIAFILVAGVMSIVSGFK